MSEAASKERIESDIPVTERVLAHYRAKTTDQAEAPMKMPIGAYNDPERYKLEIDRVFRRRPLALALSIELPGPNSYRAMTVLGVPVLLVRGEDGTVRAFLNTCRHRGAQVCEEGAGKKARFNCPYHAWSYDSRGQLVGVYGESTFGDLDRATHGLKALPCAEYVGIVWVALKPEASFEIREWLGNDFGDQLAALKLDQWHLAKQVEVPGPGWKIAFDGFLDFYHHNILHQKTVGKYAIGNMIVHDTYGPHQRIVSGRRTLGEIADRTYGEAEAKQHIRQIHSVFPNVSITGLLGDHCLVSQVFPGPTPDCTTTRLNILTDQEPVTAEQKRATEDFIETTVTAIRDEDYKMGFAIQNGLQWGANTELLYGRNEPVLQHYHTWVAKFTAQD